jgi:hypothetical protein
LHKFRQVCEEGIAGALEGRSDRIASVLEQQALLE